MLSRFCKLSHGRVPRVNPRKYSISPSLLNQRDDEDDKSQMEAMVAKKAERIPIITAKHKAYNFYKGMDLKKFDAIPIASKGWQHSKSKGDYFTIHPILDAENHFAEGEEEWASFEEFGLHPRLIESLKMQNIHKPSEIQAAAIPKIGEGNHTILSAETGCGKTLAFVLPIFNHILKWKNVQQYRDRGPNRPFAIIVTPSRELSLQTAKEMSELTKYVDINVKLVTSGRARAKMLNPSMRNVDVLIGTFGILSKMITNRIYKLDTVKHVILDEAHALFHETFDDKLEVFLRRMTFHSGVLDDDPSTPGGAQMTLVSATKPSAMPEYLNRILAIESIQNISTSNFHRVMVPQKFMRVARPDKPMLLLKIVKPRVMKNQRIVVFSNDNKTTDWMSLYFNEFNIRTISLNGDMPLAIRKGKFMEFQKGHCNVLSTTNGGARGLDTYDVNTVVNYDFPIDTADYIHRCGRTGRLGSSVDGRVINFVSSAADVALTQKIERAARRMRALPMLNIIDEHLIKEARKQSIIDQVISKPRKPRKQIRPKKKKTARRASM